MSRVAKNARIPARMIKGMISSIVETVDAITIVVL
jgi:hypothetical protein